MGESHELTRVVNGKVTYLIKTTDLLNSKLNQVLASLRTFAGTFQDWKSRYNTYVKQEHCHFNLNQEFISLYSLEVNKALSALLRLNEIDDLVRQLAHLSRKTLVGFPDLPRFLTADLELRFSRLPSLAPTIAALRNGFSLMMEPVVDFQLASSRTMQIHLVFTLPELDNTNALCTLEQLIPISYNKGKHCFGGSITRQDLLLLSCEDKRYVVKQAELDQCFHAEFTVLCPKHVLSTVEDPTWLGLKWVPASKFSFRHSHVSLPHCQNLPPLIHLGGRFYLSTTDTNLTLSGDTGSHALSLQPLGIYHFPCKYSFPFQRTGFGSCTTTIQMHFPLFSGDHFQFVPWSSSPVPNNTMFITPDFKIPTPLALDHSTLNSLNRTYNALDSDLTRRLQKVRADIASLPTESRPQPHPALVYVVLALTICNFIVLLVFYCVCLRRRDVPTSHNLILTPATRAAASTSTTAV